MNAESIRSRLLQRKVLIPAGALALTCAAWPFVSSSNGNQKDNAEAYYVAEQGTFTIALPTGGSLEAVNEVTVRNKVLGSSLRLTYVTERRAA